MANFETLQRILEIDFREMRALTGDGGMRATDSAIFAFVNNLVEFYSQFNETGATIGEVGRYRRYMQEITTKINESEYAYYLEKYRVESPDHAEVMAAACKLKSFRDLPTRMQYWAASEKFGGTVRNPVNHCLAVKNLEKWVRLVGCAEQNSFFKPGPAKLLRLEAIEKYLDKASPMSNGLKN